MYEDKGIHRSLAKVERSTLLDWLFQVSNMWRRTTVATVREREISTPHFSMLSHTPQGYVTPSPRDTYVTCTPATLTPHFPIRLHGAPHTRTYIYRRCYKLPNMGRIEPKLGGWSMPSLLSHCAKFGADRIRIAAARAFLSQDDPVSRELGSRARSINMHPPQPLFPTFPSPKLINATNYQIWV